MKLIETKRHRDQRGWFGETYHRARYAAVGVNTEFCQDNQAFSHPPFVLRGLHFQRPPHGQAKLVYCVRGRIWDVGVDLRRGSPTFGKWEAAELSAENGLQMYVPIGFAHGYLTLEPDCEVAYKVSDFYAPECEGGLAWNNPDVAIDWPLGRGAAILSDKDQRLPGLAEVDAPFVYEGEPLTPLRPRPLGAN